MSFAAALRSALRNRLPPESWGRLRNLRARALATPEYFRRYAAALQYSKYAVDFSSRHKGRRSWTSSIPFDLLQTMERGVMQSTYRGIPMAKWPFEVALYPMLVWDLKPKTIIEIGSLAGGSALWLSDLMKTFEIDGRVISIDRNLPKISFRRDNIEFFECDALHLERVLTPSILGSLERPLLVIEDSAHFSEICLAVARFFDRVLRPGDYMIIEDSNIAELGVGDEFNGGPIGAIAQFLAETEGRYEIDARYCDRFGPNVTSNPNGYLRRVA